MTNALAPLSVLLSFAMGLMAFDGTPMALFETDKGGKSPGASSDRSQSGGVSQPITIASKPAGARFFILDAQVNGVQTRFIVDTGANTMVLRRSDAEKAAVAPGSTTRLHTANGHVPVEQTTIDNLTISGITLSDVQAVVADDRLPHSLIGLDALDQMGRIVIDGSSIKVF